MSAMVAPFNGTRTTQVLSVVTACFRKTGVGDKKKTAAKNTIAPKFSFFFVGVLERKLPFPEHSELSRQ